MGENEKLRFTCEEVLCDFSTFNSFFGATTPWVDGETSATTPWNGNPCGKLTVANPTLEEGIARLKSEQECIAEKYKSIEEKTIDKDFPMALKPTKRKHYKPKFTL